MSNLVRHPFHLVDESPWPLLASIAGLGLTSGLIRWFHFNSYRLVLVRVILLITVTTQWWRDVRREGSLLGQHSRMVELGLRWGIILFIVSEVFFFVRFFWAFFHSRLAVNVEIGRQWPPKGIISFNAFEIPLLNTVILLSSGVTVTWAHHALISGNHSQTLKALGLTIGLGAYFTLIQAKEYADARFSFADSVYGSTFFIATGFHGIHVLVGRIFLLVCFIRINRRNIRNSHHFGFEAAAWYWHLVDVVWLFLFIIIYWWGGA